MAPAEPLPSAFASVLAASSTSSSTWSLSSSLSPPDASWWTEALSRALLEARKGIGRTFPNPPVGCVLLDARGEVVAVGHHEAAGRPHAEVNALEQLLAARGPGAAKGLTAVVTLEPCAHHGRTPPCAERLVQEGIGRVVVGTKDPNPRVDGRGIDVLRAAGVEVTVATGPLAAASAALIAPFATTMTQQRVYVVLKLATSLDGRVATRTGASRFITGSVSRAVVHRLRDAVDAVLVGASTVIVDDPALTVRDVFRDDGVAIRDPLRVILDRRATVPVTARVFDPPGALVVHDVFVTPSPLPGVERLSVAGLDPGAVLQALHRRGLTAVMVEAGPRLATALLRAGVVDELWWFQAPMLVGNDGVPACAALGVERLDDALRFAPVLRVACDADSLVVMRPVHGAPAA